MPEVASTQLRSGGPVGQDPIGPTQVVAGHRETLAATPVDQESVTEPVPGLGPETTHVWFEWPARLGASKLIWLLVTGPPERKNNVTISPAPSNARTAPITTSPVRTEVGRGGLPIHLRGFPTVRRGR